VLVLSEFTGAAVFMKPDSLLFNPADADLITRSDGPLVGDENLTKWKDDRKETTNLVLVVTSVLVLSEFTGAAVFMKPDSLLFNPADADDLSNAL
jgi:trehalose-6-phosphate synthase